MDSTADHEFDSNIASQALLTAVSDLCSRTGKEVQHYDGTRMGDLYQLAVRQYGVEELPEFWIIWNGWNTASDDPAPWGDL